jgi:voltage-gated potassium channel
LLRAREAPGGMDARSERIANRLDPWLIVATLLVVPVLILQASDVSDSWRALADVGDWVVWLAFLGELVVMLAVVPNRRQWIAAHPLDVAIVVLTPPFAGSLLVSVRVLRLLRLVRLLRLASLARAVFSLAGVRYAALLAALTAVAGAQAFSTVENVPAGDALYWSLTTMTTVGYGDVTPETDMGRAIAVAVMLVGIGFVAILTGAIAQRFIAPAEESLAMGEQELRDRLDRIAARLDQLETASRDRAV